MTETAYVLCETCEKNLIEASNGFSMKRIIEENLLMDFGSALSFIKRGYKAKREGWNGKEMFIYYVSGSALAPDQLRNEALDHVGPMVDDWEIVTINPHIDMKAADGSIVVGWLASQADMISEDWSIF